MAEYSSWDSASADTTIRTHHDQNHRHQKPTQAHHGSVNFKAHRGLAWPARSHRHNVCAPIRLTQSWCLAVSWHACAMHVVGTPPPQGRTCGCSVPRLAACGFPLLLLGAAHHPGFACTEARLCPPCMPGEVSVPATVDHERDQVRGHQPCKPVQPV